MLRLENSYTCGDTRTKRKKSAVLETEALIVRTPLWRVETLSPVRTLLRAALYTAAGRHAGIGVTVLLLVMLHAQNCQIEYVF